VRVEEIRVGWCWGYHLRPIRGHTTASLRAVQAARWPADQLVTAAAISGAESAYNPTANT
jgi:hypothetical protein